MDFKTNIILCDLGHLHKLNAGDKNVDVSLEILLFGIDCVFVQIKHFVCVPKIYSNEKCDSDSKNASKVFFYASTSGSCGELKSIGVTYKCFMPNIIQLG